MVACNDKNCPVHGSVKLRGRNFIGAIVSTRMHKTVTVEWIVRKYIPKYERSEKKKTKIHAHLPECMDVHVGDTVILRETKPLSKTKHFAVVKKIEKNAKEDKE